MRRPKISTNLAISADGKISSVSKRPSGWTSPQDHTRFLELRENADAILVGRGTLEADQMTMTAKGRSPLRCVISRTGRIDPKHPIFSTPGGEIHLLVTGPADPPTGFESTSPVIVHRMSLETFLETLADVYQVKSLHCEGGGELIRSLAEMDAIDEFHVTLAGHTIFGGEKAPTTTGIPRDFLPKSTGFEVGRFEARPEIGECFLTYRRKR
jgi:2,5-diamino-6-(ribosylamino)-4(3H)-pyrimidinone 5'-phosphate reductase